MLGSKPRLFAAIVCVFVALQGVVQFTVFKNDPDVSFKIANRNRKSDVVSIDASHHETLNYGSMVRTSDHAIFLISMGKEAMETKIVERCHMSIRRRGNWSGRVILLTDAPADRYTSLLSQDKGFTVMNPRPNDFNWETKDDMPYKRFKTMILDYIDRDDRFESIELVYYLDVDIVVGGNLDTFFSYIENKYMGELLRPSPRQSSTALGNKNSSGDVSGGSKMYFFRGNFDRLPVQGGQFVLHRRNSRGCLEEWRRIIDANPHETKDQKSLRAMLNDTLTNETPTCHIEVMDQLPHLYFPNERFMKATLKSGQYATLNHIKNTQHAKSVDRKLQSNFIAALLNMTKSEQNSSEIADQMTFGA